ncbi:hypothetical protein Q0590_00060 [Rhodocytophaga aerolata]|uniref:EF-hand domain-containing protein n=1 Tax=Rhodocytophaga aerolata TaxID=455078 RepID=A0ABT8QXP3_9BACT|nr:hypothetical protein [Rhodocytophaga aerolata]MDO1444617.1 hypothetical protein [Rhodocytophaga aerolata]
MKKLLRVSISAAKSSKLLVQLLVLLVLILAACQDNNFVVNPSTLCSCNAGVDDDCFPSVQAWRHTVDNLLEVSASDFTNGDFVGAECQGEMAVAWDWPPFLFNCWRPVNGFKYNMSATLHQFNWHYDDDEDWNLHIIPTQAFNFLISDVEALHDESSDEHRKNCGDSPCMEAEISPDKQFWNNPWFFAPGVDPADTEDNGYSWLEGRQLGFYGLWVMDANHDFKSEIHNSEMIWFKDHFENPAPLDIFWLLFMQDNTGRFDDSDNFDCDGDAPAGWKPWAQSPLSGQFNIAFEVNPSREVVNFSIVELFNRFVVTSQDVDGRRDADDGKSHALEINGRVVVRVEETQQNDDDLGVTFTNLCLRPDGKLQGFVTIRSKIGGDDDKDEEGFHILYVTRSLGSTRPDVVRPDIAFPRLLITSKEVGGSIKVEQDFFVGDLQLTLHGNDSTSSRDFLISKVEFAAKGVRQELRFEQSGQSKEVLIRNLPLLPGGKIIVTTASGLNLAVSTPSIQLAPGISDTLIQATVDEGALKFLPSAVGGIPNVSIPSNKQLLRSQEYHLKFLPRYAAYKGNNVMTDKPSLYAAELNEAIIGKDEKKMQVLLQSTQPFNISWSFSATNLLTGKPVPICTNNQTMCSGIQVELLSGKMKNDSLKVKFLSQGAEGIIEFIAKGSLTDMKGKTTVVEHRLWSHGFSNSINNVEEIATLIQALSGLKDRSILIPPAPTRKPQTNNPPQDDKTRQAYIINAYLKETVKDKQITIEELRDVLGALRKFGYI